MADPRPASINQIRAEQLVERIFGDPEFADIAPKIHGIATKLFGGEIKEPPAVAIKKTIEPEVSELRKALEASNEQLAKAVERMNARDRADEEAKVLREMEASVSTAVGKYGLTEEGRAKMLERMKETRNYTDVEAAAAYVAHNAPPSPSSGPSWLPRKTNFYGSADPDETFKKLHTDPAGFLDEELARFTRDPNAYASEAA